MRQIPFAGQLTQRDLVAVNALATRKFRLFLRIGGIILILVNLQLFTWNSFMANPLSVGFLATGFLLIAIFGGPPARLGVHRAWTSNKLIQRSVQGAVSEEGMKWSIEGISSSEIPWDLLLRYRASNSMVLLYQGANQYYCVLRRYFVNDSDWADFKKIVADKLPKK
ncbi:MAG TPA: YcxB family protein [Terriglobia bacterium]|nr:YcxB family protein [Terriglobia bacterium]